MCYCQIGRVCDVIPDARETGNSRAIGSVSGSASRGKLCREKIRPFALIRPGIPSARLVLPFPHRSRPTRDIVTRRFPVANNNNQRALDAHASCTSFPALRGRRRAPRRPEATAMKAGERESASSPSFSAAVRRTLGNAEGRASARYREWRGYGS